MEIKKRKENVVSKVENLANKVNLGIKRRLIYILGIIPALLVGTPLESYADISSVKTDVNEETALAGIINVIVKVARYVGFVLVAVGIIGIIESQMSENPERKSSAAKMLAVGVLLIGAEFVLKATGIVS